MKLNIPDEYLPLIVESLEHQYAYTRAINRDDSRYRQAADWVKRNAFNEPLSIYAPQRSVKVGKRSVG